MPKPKTTIGELLEVLTKEEQMELLDRLCEIWKWQIQRKIPLDSWREMDKTSLINSTTAI